MATAKDPGDSVTRLRAAIPDAAVLAPAVSRWSVGMHVHHCTLAMINIGDLLAACDSPKTGRPSWIGAVLLFLGRIPRGRGRAPRVAIPAPDLAPDELPGLLDRAEEGLRKVAELPRTIWFRHFVFGVLERDQALRFVRIHNDHHLRIIADIRKAAGRA